MKIAMLEDDPQQATMVKSWLEENGYSVIHHDNGEGFLKQIDQSPFDMAILDWELPDLSGLETLSRFRKAGHAFPVLFATQRDSEEDIVNALKAGADDYLIKPLRKGELLARLEAMSRRAGIQPEKDQLGIGNIVLDQTKRTITVDGEIIKTTQKDFDVAVIFLSNIGKILTREYLLKSVWGVDAGLNTRTVDVHVSRVRRSLKINPDMGYCINNIYQHGYRLEKVTAHD